MNMILSAVLALFLCAPVTNQPSGLIRHYKFDTSGSMDNGGAEMWVDFSQDPSSSPITSSDGNYSLVVNGSPVRYIDGTWPDGLTVTDGYAWDLTSGYLSLADGSGGDDFDPSGDFSVVVVVIFDSVDANTRGVVGKGVSGSSQLGWGIHATNNDLSFTITKDGSTTNTIEQTNQIEEDVPLFIVATYDWVADGTSEMNLYVNEASAVTDATSPGPVHDSTGAFEIGRYNGANAHSGRILHYAFFDGEVLESARIDQLKNQWHGNISTCAIDVPTTNANPQSMLIDDPAGGAQPFLIQFGDDVPPVGVYGIYTPDAFTNQLPRSSFESFGLDAGCTNEPTGWSCTCTDGDGAVNIYEDNTNIAEGNSSLSVVISGTTGNMVCISGCMTTGVGQDIDVYGYVKRVTGVSQHNEQIVIYEYDTAACGSYLKESNVNYLPSSADWTLISRTHTAGSWHASTSSYKIAIREYGNNATIAYDAFTVAVVSDDMDSDCHCDTASACTCDYHDVTIDNHGLGIGSWTMEFDVRSPNDWGDATTRYIAYLPGTAGNNNRVDLYFASDTLTFVVYTSAGVAKTATVAAAGNADTNYTVRAVKAADGDIWTCFDGTCGTRATGAITDGVGTSLSVGSNGTTGAHLWIKDLKIYNRTK